MTAPTTQPAPPGTCLTDLTDHSPGPLDSTAQLTTQITTRLASGRARAARTSPSGSRPASRPARPALVAVAHGSRVPAAAWAAEALLDRVRALRPDLPVRLGHIELSQPLLDDTLAGLQGDVVLVPLLLGRGYHVKVDIPEALARAPRVRGRVAAPLGPHPLLAEALHARLVEAGWCRPPGGAVVLAAAGSRDPDSAVDTGRTAALLRTMLGVPVVPAYASAARPTVPEAVAALTERGSRRIAVASYFTAPGRFSARCAAVSPWLASAPLGADPAMAELILRRYDDALAAPAAPVSRSVAPAMAAGR